MAKIKTQKITVIKRDGADVYTFRNGVAVVPGIKWRHQPMKVTLQEFREASAEIDGQ